MMNPESAPARSDTAPAVTLACSDCGAEVAAWARYCPYCGEVFEERRSVFSWARRHALQLLAVAVVLTLLVGGAAYWLWPERWHLTPEDQVIPWWLTDGRRYGKINVFAPQQEQEQILKALILLRVNTPEHFKVINRNLDAIYYFQMGYYSDPDELSPLGIGAVPACRSIYFTGALRDHLPVCVQALLAEYVANSFYAGESGEARYYLTRRFVLGATRPLYPIENWKKEEREVALAIARSGRSIAPELDLPVEAPTEFRIVPEAWLTDTAPRGLPPEVTLAPALTPAPTPHHPDAALRMDLDYNSWTEGTELVTISDSCPLTYSHSLPSVLWHLWRAGGSGNVPSGDSDPTE